MASRVALVACKSANEGPWTLAKGNEVGLSIVHLMKGERVRIDMKVGELSESATFDLPGTFPWPWKRVERYRACKETDDSGSGSPTTVEIVLNG